MSSQNYSEIHTKSKILKGRREYMFRGIVKKNSGYCLRDINKPITYTSVRKDVLSVLNKLGLSSEGCSLHSMRAVGCIMAAHLGVKKYSLKKHCRWKSDRVKDRHTHPYPTALGFTKSRFIVENTCLVVKLFRFLLRTFLLICCICFDPYF